MSMAHRSGPVIGTSGRPLEPVFAGIKVDAERFAWPHLTEVSRTRASDGLRLSPPRPLALKPAPDRRDDVPAQPAAVHLSTTLLEPKFLAWPVPPADTALQPARWWERAMPPPHHTRVRGRLMQKAAEGLRLAVDVGRGARGQQARAHSGSDSHPRGQYRTLLHRGPAPCMLQAAVDDHCSTPSSPLT